MMRVLFHLRLAARRLRRTPLVTLAIVASLTISIAAVTTAFSIVDAVLVRALPFRNAANLFWMSSVRPQRTDAPFTLPEFIDYARQARSVELSALTSWNAALETTEVAQRLQGIRISANAFNVLGASAAAGRLFIPSDDRPDAARVVLLGYGFWQSRFGGTADAIGRVLQLNGEPYQVVGVLPRHFPLPFSDVDVAVPLAPGLDPLRDVRSSVNFLRVFGVHRAGMVAADRELSSLAAELKARFPTDYATKLGVKLTPLHEHLVGESRPVLVVMLGGAALLLAVALANVLNLLLIRGMARQGEMAVRRALGASQIHVALGASAEAGLLAGAGALSGVLLANTVVAIVSRSAIKVPRLNEVTLDLRSLVLAIVIMAACTAIFSLIPVIAAWRSDPRQALSAIGRGQHGVRGQSRARSVFLVAQVSLAVLLCIVTATLVTSMARLQRVDLGYRPDSTLVARLTLPAARYRSVTDVAQFARALESELLATPGVTGTGAVSVAPLTGLLYSVPFQVPGRAPDESRDQPNANLRAISPGYLTSIRASLLRGRSFAASDDEAGAPVALVSAAFARRLFGDTDPLGRQVLINDNNTGPRPLSVVGVIRDMRHIDIDGAPSLDIFIPLAQVHPDGLRAYTGSLFWAIRGPSAAGGAFTRAVARIDRNVAVARIRPMSTYIDDVLAPRRVSVATLLSFAVVAVVLATIGVYSVIAYSVEQRRRELGLRLALGASRSDVARHVMGPAILYSLLGIAAGLAGALVTRQLVSGLLFGVTATDPVVMGVVAALVLTTGALAAAIPARRAARIDPATALSAE
jgi:putative ABC transport system permease protein